MNTLSKPSLEDLLKIKSSLKEIIMRVKNEFDDDFVFNLSVHSNCVIGRLFPRKYPEYAVSNFNKVMKDKFGFNLGYDVSGFHEDAPKILVKVNSLFAHDSDSINTISAKDWRKRAKKVLKSIKKEIKSIKVSNS